MWRDLPIYTEAEAIDYAEGCAERWCAAVELGRLSARARATSIISLP
jgi:hypothetical protein